ncbi:hypothetical protein BJ741DRAFT_597656 [Chytriomyces cf. hyalinus JEL632]|nr:hypothetical protein BJ741DRAFT_597656 [Chytriomyces cf. hyalinus JEL632]
MSFNPETVQALLKAASNNPDFKMNKESLAVTCELLTAFTTEVVMRSTQQALQRRSSMAHASELDGGDTKLDVNCLERVLPQLLLDFN